MLNKVPPHLVGDQIVAEARRLDGVSSAALYLVDIDGSRLLLLAGSPEFPAQLPAPLAVGPELPRAGVPGLRREVEDILPGVTLSPLYLRGRAIGALVALGAAEAPLAELARQAAAAVELAKPYTDVLDIVRRRKDISAASEIQQNLLPPRIGRLSGATVAGNVLPCYDVGGDWFDYVDNADGGWLGLADAIGMGPTAAALASIALGSLPRRPSQRRGPGRGGPLHGRVRHQGRGRGWSRERGDRPLARAGEHLHLDQPRPPGAARDRGGRATPSASGPPRPRSSGRRRDRRPSRRGAS